MTDEWRKENKARRIDKQCQQNDQVQYWHEHEGKFCLSQDFPRNNPIPHRNKMCPSGLTLCHPAGPTLLKHATQGYPTLTGKPWTREMVQEVVDRGPHKSALAPDAIKQLTDEVAAKVAAGQACIVNWLDIWDYPPHELKFSPISIIPHKSPCSFCLCNGGRIPSVNEASIKSAPKGSIDQIGQSLSCIIYAMVIRS
jgi:hypothetical protein